MDIAVATLQIWRRKIWLIPVVLVAALVFVSVAYRVSLNPPGLESRSLSYGFASSSLLVDSEKSSLASVEIPVAALGERAAVYAQLLGSDPVRQRIGREAGIPWQTVSVDVSETNTATTGPERGTELVSESSSRQIFARVDQGQPIIEISAQASTAQGAVALAEAAATALPDYIEELQRNQGIDGPYRVALSEVGRASGGVVGGANNIGAGIFAAVMVLGLGALLILLLPRAWESLQRADEEDRLRTAAAGDGLGPAGSSDHPENGYSPDGVPAEPSESKRARRGKTTASSE